MYDRIQTLTAFAETVFPPELFQAAGEIELRLAHPGGKHPGRKRGLAGRRWFPGVDALVSFAIPEDLHVWIGPALRGGRKGTKGACTAVASLWVDIDEGGREARDRALETLQERGLPQPTLQVETSPEKYHLWWKLTRIHSLVDHQGRSEFEQALKSLLRLLGGDAACGDCSRVMRLPGSRNVKPDYGPERPVARIVSHEPDRRMDLEELRRVSAAAELPLGAGAPQPGRVGAAATGRSPSPEPLAGRGPLPASAEVPFLSDCRFVLHAWENSATLSEPLWSALAWTLAQLPRDGERLFHELSRHHGEYDASEANSVFRRGRERGYLASCSKVRDLGFECPSLSAGSGLCRKLPTRFPHELIQLGPGRTGNVVLVGGRTVRIVEDGGRHETLAEFVVVFEEEIRRPDGRVHLSARIHVPGGIRFRLVVPGEALGDYGQLTRLLSGTLGSRYRGVRRGTLFQAVEAWLANSDPKQVQINGDFGFTVDGRSFVGLADEAGVRFEGTTSAGRCLGLGRVSGDRVDEMLQFLLRRWPEVGCGPFASRLGKTAAGTLAQCFFGDFSQRGRQVSFGSTALSLEGIAHEFRGALLHIDDAKGSAVPPGQRQALLGVLQRLHDRTARSRLRSDGTPLLSRGSRTTTLVGGEEILFQEASIRGRYFEVGVGRARQEDHVHPAGADRRPARPSRGLARDRPSPAVRS